MSSFLKPEVFGIHLFVLELIALPLLTIASLMGLAGCAARIPIVDGQKRPLMIFCVSCFFLILAILISSIGALDHVNVIKSMLKWTEIFAVTAMVFIYASNEKKFRRVWWLLWSGHALILLLSLWELFVGLSSFGVSIIALRRISGYSAIFLAAMILPFSFQRKKALFAFLLSSVLAFLSLSRGAWLVLGFLATYCFVDYCLRRSLKRTVGVALLIAFSITVVAVSTPIVSDIAIERIKTSLSMKLPSNRERLGMAEAGWRAFATNPMTGIGAENFANYLHREGVPKYVSTSEPEKLTPHNFFLQIAAETGLVGLISIVIIFLSIYRVLLFPTSGRTVAPGPYLHSLRLYYFVLIFHLFTAFIAAELRFAIGAFWGLALAQTRLYRLPKQKSLL